MSSVKLQGNASGTGSITLFSPNTNNNRTINLPDIDGTIVTSDASGNVGIGTSSPSTRLQVNFSSATAYSSGATGNGLLIYNTSTTNGQYAGIFFQGEPTAGNAGQASIYGTTTGSGAMDLVFSTRGSSTLAERARIDSSGNFQFNSGYGSVAIAYGCRVWVSYNTVTSTSIRGSGGVSSLTDNGTGDTTINFSVTMPDTNYSVVGATKLADSTATTNNTMIVGPFSFATTSVRIYTTRPGDSLNDCAIVNISIFR